MANKSKPRAICTNCGIEIADAYRDGMLHVCSDRCGCMYLGKLFRQIRRENGLDENVINKDKRFKWTDAMVKRLLYLRENGVLMKDIAAEFGISTNAVTQKIYGIKKCSAKAATNAEQNRDV